MDKDESLKTQINYFIWLLKDIIPADVSKPDFLLCFNPFLFANISFFFFLSRNMYLNSCNI